MFFFFFFCLRQSDYEKEPKPVQTLLTEAEKTAFNDTWLNVSREIQSFLCNEGLSGCSVELAADRAFDMDRKSPLNANDRIHAQWTEILDSIWLHCDLNDVNSIGCFRIGKTDDWRQNLQTVLTTIKR